MRVDWDADRRPRADGALVEHATFDPGDRGPGSFALSSV